MAARESERKKILEESDCSVHPYKTHVLACEQFALVHCCDRTTAIVPAVLLLVVSDSPETSGDISLFGAVCVDLLRLFFYRMWGGLCCLSVQHVKSKPVVN